VNRELTGALQEKATVPLQVCLLPLRLIQLIACLKNIVSNGGSILVPKRAIPGVGYQAHFKDPERNVIGIMENDPSAR
jgi:uncharacterized protein